MSSRDIEQQLEELANDWPGSSVAETVASRLPVEPLMPIRTPRNDFRVISWVGALATVLVFTAAWWISLPDSMQSALQDSLRGVDSWHVEIEVFRDAETSKGEIWFDREQGFRVEGDGQVTVDDGKVSHSWAVTPGQATSSGQATTPAEANAGAITVLKRPSMDGVSMVAEMLDLSQIPDDWHKQRSPDHDRQIGSIACRAYVVQHKHETHGPDDSQSRSIILLDESDRPRQMIYEQREQDGWKIVRRATVDYERQIPAAKFVLNFPEGANVIDVQTAFLGRFPIEKAAASVEKDGVLFAVHDLESIDDGSFYVVSSVRGTPDYLQKYPPTPRRFNLNYTALDVVSQMSSHGSVAGGTQVMLYQVEWQGVQYLWWLLTLDRHGRENVLRDGDRRIVPIPLAANHLHKDRRDARGVQLQTRVEIPVTIAESATSSLEQVIAKARLDMKLASAVMGETKSLPIAGAANSQTVTFTSFDDVTNADYAKQLRKARWQVASGDYSGADPPDDVDLATATADQKPAKIDEPEPLSNEPVELPDRIGGRVVDEDGKPVVGARVLVRVRRFSPKKDHDENAGPGPWTATTDETGEYVISPSGTIRPSSHEVRIKIVADGYAEESINDYKKALLDGAFPTVTLRPGRKIHGRLIDGDGNEVAEAVLRFQHNGKEQASPWDSGPIAVGDDGGFSISIPVGGKATGVVYPEGFAPRFIEINEGANQGDILLDPGVKLKGRVIDQSGDGVPGTIVGFRRMEFREMYAFVAVIGSAVRTDEKGYFQLPPLTGEYELTVARLAPDYKRQMMLGGREPPTIEPMKINVDMADPEVPLVFREKD